MSIWCIALESGKFADNQNEKVPYVLSVSAPLRVLHAISTKGKEGGGVNRTLWPQGAWLGFAYLLSPKSPRPGIIYDFESRPLSIHPVI